MAKSFSRKHGFTLVEVIVAITVVNVMVALFCRMFIAQNSLVASLEEWCADDPVYYMQPDADPLARTVAVPAALPRAPEVSDVLDSVWAYDVEVVKLERDLGGLLSRAYVEVSLDDGLGDSGDGDGDDGDDEDGKGKGKGKEKEKDKDD